MHVGWPTRITEVNHVRRVEHAFDGPIMCGYRHTVGSQILFRQQERSDRPRRRRERKPEGTHVCANRLTEAKEPHILDPERSIGQVVDVLRKMREAGGQTT